MSENNININPKFSFCKVTHRYPKKEEYVISKKIKVIENTPVSPSFLKKIFHATSYIFHKINMIFLIRSINNNKGLGSFGHIENREVSYKNNSNRSCYNHIDISKLDMINKLINNSNAKFDFYSFCDYLTEVKMVENYFSLSNDHDFINPNDQDLSIIFNAIIHTRLIGLNDDDFKNIYKLIIKRYNYEKIHLNKENSFISNFSSVKKRDELISFINLLIIAENEIGILSKLDQELSDKIKNNLSIIMKEMLGSEYQEYTTYEELSMAWMNTHVYRYKQGECIEIDKGKIDVIENQLAEVKGEVKEEVNGEVKEEVKGEVKEEVNGEVKEEVKGEVKEEVNGEVKEEVKGEVKEEVNGEVKEEVKGEVKEE
ncbi:hypothetical protein ABN241_08960, partial [Proteus terrae]|uniref:hypothetical protein n=1 Tax=Proteus terrae TaxID=1574161 RepID=UPI0032D9F3F7